MNNYNSFLPSTVIRDYGYASSNPLYCGDFAHAPRLDSDSEDDMVDRRRHDDEYFHSSEGEEADDDDDDDDYDYDDYDDISNEAGPRDEINRKARALFDFVPENDNEVSLTEGQIIWISYRHGQGWLVAEDPETGENGLVPEEYVEIFHKEIGVEDEAKPFLPEILRQEKGYTSDSSEWVDTDDGEDKKQQQQQQEEEEEAMVGVTDKINTVTI
ncbi:uncharacterized protein SPAPADRAFT_52893 [Spathaspora passalidarum NRRL Y-27907]|uniref:SH3 domain-containing protein n=1 Tax=Spathaspora passalidarum (strain NRRL Y-27907 / 11-Y1) TaxID=619300 RepID=G3AUW5_SPAPN|nr:uncharacterized protein SPAPADRAFT_52893 [Spathaspora passalidarum NRRL Y-27907]EGW30056.1 hypothetical protein SPAPADRAFT_52893 [Spathaspora passalidarum NRRL Y-27907]